MAAGATVCGGAVAVYLYATDRLTGVNLFWAYLIASFVGDLFLAIAFEIVAPTEITVGPGERQRKDSPLREKAKVVSGFSGSNRGKVMVRGEIWAARCITPDTEVLEKGEELEIMGREGLTLLVAADAREA